MCLFSRSGYRPFINPPPYLGNLLCRYKSMLNFIPVSFCFFLLILGLGLGLGLGSVIDRGFRF